jgi:hypothetical protein
VTRETFGGRARRLGAPEVHDPDLRTDDVGPAVADLVGAMPQAATTAARLALGGTAAEARRVARTIGGKPAQVSQLFAEIGDAGAAAAPLALCDALDSAAAGEVVLAVAVGSGAVALGLEVADVPAAGRRGRAVAEQARGGREVDYVAYLRHGRRLSSFKGDAA